MSFDFPLILDGAGRVATGERESRLARAVISSLFTWARARDGDELPTPESPRMGFWGDTYSPVTGDRWGSRLWLLARETLTASTVAKARDLAKEALEWMVVDKVAERIQVEATRNGGKVEVLAATEVKVTTAKIILQANVEVVGKTTFTGEVWANGKRIDNTHKHPLPGGGQTLEVL